MASKMRTPRAGPEPSGSAPKSGGGPTGLVTFVVGSLITAYLFRTNPDPKSFEAYRFINAGLCLWVPLLVILLGLRQEPGQFGLARGDRRLGLRWALICWAAMLLVVVFASYQPQFARAYRDGYLRQWISGVGQPFDGSRVNLEALLYYELGMGFYFFCWEFFFRGFWLFGLQKSRLGTWGAVIVQSLPFTLLHWSWHPGASKPPLEVLSAFPGGIALGILAVRTRSFLYGYLVHWAVSATLDLFLLAPFIFRHFG